MKRLRSLTVCHDSSEDDDVVDRLCAWVRRAISGSPIEQIRFCCDEFLEDCDGPRGFDTLIDHLSRINSNILRVLDLNGWLISASSVSILFESCVALEEFVAALDADGFVCIPLNHLFYFYRISGGICASCAHDETPTHGRGAGVLR
jgi:hypothetical protein